MSRITLLRIGAAAVLAVIPATPGFAQMRPKLASSADTNDWRAYFDYGVSQLRTHATQADLAFQWAARLGPNRGEPLYGRWVSFWMRNLSVFFDYRAGKRRVTGADSAYALLARAYTRNPMLPPSLEVMIWDELPGEWGESPQVRGLLASAMGQYADAATLWERAIRNSANERGWLRYNRASVLTQLRRLDEAVKELEALSAETQRRESDRVLAFYDSKEIIYHAVGMLHLARGDAAAARAALGQALTENLGYAPAHAFLGDLALTTGDSITAVTELAQAVELAPAEVWFRFRFGHALYVAGQIDSAAAVIADVNRREPLLADAYLELGLVRERQADRAGALNAYTAYLMRAPRRDTTKIQWVQQRLHDIAP